MTKLSPPSSRLCASLGTAIFLLLTIASTIPGQAEQQRQVLHSHVRPVITSGQAAPVGLLPANQRLNLAIMLPLRDQSGLTSFLDRLYDPSSPDFRHFLSVAEFTEAYGPTERDYQAVVDFAKANGFTITKTPQNRLLVDINGTVAQINKAFHVVMTVYQHPTENRTFYSPDREPSLGLSASVSHIAGLNDYSIPHPKLKRLAKGSNFHSNATGSGPQGAYRPSDMRAAYYGGTALTGSGQSVGMLEFDGYETADVTGDEGGVTYSVPITNVLVDGGSAASDGDDGEQALDIAQAIGMAPGLTSVRVYIAPI
jgi:subtilase family serine protease